MGQFEREALTAAQWWADQLRNTTTGVEARREALNGAIARAQDSRQASNEQIEAFEKALARQIELILDQSHGRLVVAIDYDTPGLLLDAGTEAGIDLSWRQLGVKKVVAISCGSVAASGGDGQQYVELDLIEE